MLESLVAPSPVELSFNLKTDYMRSMITNGSISAALDGERTGQSGWRCLLQILGIGGSSPSASIGDAQVASNLDAPSALRLYQAWIEKDLLPEGALSLLAGLHDLNSEFYVTESSTGFLNSSFGVGAEFGQSGSNGPSIFPTTATALRIRARNGDTEIRAALYDGVPSDSLFSWSPREGFLAVAEISRLLHFTEGSELEGRLSAGAWHYTQAMEEAPGKSQGLYATWNQPFTPTLSGFVRAGIAASGSSPFSATLAAGVWKTGAIASRPQDGAGFAAVLASAAASDAGAAPEKVFEATYRAEITPWLRLQPDLQLILNPGLRRDATAAWVGALRLELTI